MRICVSVYFLKKSQPKEDLGLRTSLFSWFLCPVFYGIYYPHHSKEDSDKLSVVSADVSSNATSHKRQLIQVLEVVSMISSLTWLSVKPAVDDLEIIMCKA
jgi:hypothetical protein